jgi:hypothetical protein
VITSTSTDSVIILCSGESDWQEFSRERDSNVKKKKKKEDYQSGEMKEI